MRRFLMVMTLAAGVTLAGPLVSATQACPLCKAANESDQDGEPNLKPKAYMYSILFMLAMPATLLGAYGVIFWRATRSLSADSQDASLDSMN